MPAVITAGILFNTNNMKYNLNIDTLIVTGLTNYTGTGDIVLTEGVEDTPISVLSTSYTTKNVRLLADFLSLAVKTPKGLNGEIKRILMALHLARLTGCTTDVVYPKDFKKNTYTSIYERNITFKVLLSSKKNEFLVKKVIVSNNTLEEYAVLDYLKDQSDALELLNAQTKELTESIETVFNRY
jgi:hypothetical protein